MTRFLKKEFKIYYFPTKKAESHAVKRKRVRHPGLVWFFSLNTYLIWIAIRHYKNPSVISDTHRKLGSKVFTVWYPVFSCKHMNLVVVGKLTTICVSPLNNYSESISLSPPSIILSPSLSSIHFTLFSALIGKRFYYQFINYL